MTMNHHSMIVQNLRQDGDLGLSILDSNPSNPWKEVLHGGHGFAWEETPVNLLNEVPPPLRSYQAAAGEIGNLTKRCHVVVCPFQYTVSKPQYCIVFPLEIII